MPLFFLKIDFMEMLKKFDYMYEIPSLCKGDRKT